MGRPERNVDIESGPVAELACELRALRQAAGTPAYRTLAARANYSATVLSRAASGRELPSLAVLLAYVSACGGDLATWEARWTEVADDLARGNGAPPAATAENPDPAFRVPGAGASRPDRATRKPAEVVRRGLRNVARKRRRALAVVLAVAAVAGWVMALAGFAGDSASHAASKATAGGATDVRPAATTPPADLSDGNDPSESGCAPGAETVAQAPVVLAAATTIAGVPRSAGTVVGLVELRYSARCHAAWARATPSPAYNVASLGSVTVTVTRQSDETYSKFRVAVMTIVYGDLLLTHGGCLTAAAEFQFAGGARAAAQAPCWAGS